MLLGIFLYAIESHTRIIKVGNNLQHHQVQPLGTIPRMAHQSFPAQHEQNCPSTLECVFLV